MKRILSLVLVLSSAAAPARAGSPHTSSSNITLVAQIVFPSAGDLELFSRSLREYMERDGTFVQVEDSDAPVIRHFALVTGAPKPRIIDVTDPERPYLVAFSPCGGWDVDVRDDGKVAVFASGPCPGAIGGNAILDLDDVYNPKVIAGAPGSAHTLRLHPGGGFLYLSDGKIWDIREPASPVQAGNFAQYGLYMGHTDLSFSEDGKRMYWAAFPVYIFDTTDPARPVVISRFAPPGMVIVHDTMPTPDGRFLFVSEEAVGGCPYGGVSVWDITLEAVPVFLGEAWAGAGPVTTGENEEPGTGESTLLCSSHVMTLDPGGRSFSIGWYRAGTRVFDISGLYAAPVAVAYGTKGVGVVEKAFVKPANSWTSAAKQYAALPGYVFSADYEIGFYVSRFL